MSSALLAHLSTLFGQQEDSDCILEFYCRSSGATAGGEGEQDCPAGLAKRVHDFTSGDAYASPEGPDAKRRKAEALLPTGSVVLGDPLQAHKLVICGGSPRFRAQADRWIQEQGQCGSGSKLLLRVPLGEAAELPHALSAIRFMYTGKPDVNDALSLLQVRRQAAYLQVEGCVEACDKALLASITAPSPSHQQQQYGTLAGVVQLYNCRDMLSSIELEQDSVRSMLRACRQQLVKHVSSISDQQSAGVLAGGPSLGELLVWAFGDAPSLLSDPEAKKHMESLSATAMEAMLGCDCLATDSEDTVLLMLSYWLASNATSIETRQRLCKQIRLSHLSRTYLLRVLPVLTWFPIKAQELRFLQEYAIVHDVKRYWLQQKLDAQYDVESPWYCDQRRPVPFWIGGRSYEWFADATKLKEAARGPKKVLWLIGKFLGGADYVVANGFEWYPSVYYKTGREFGALYLFCHKPASLGIEFATEDSSGVAQPGSCRLVAYKWGAAGERERAFDMSCDTLHVGFDAGWGQPSALPLQASSVACQGQEGAVAVGGSSTAPQSPLLAGWAPYIKEGKLWGTLKWTWSVRPTASKCVPVGSCEASAYGDGSAGPT